MIFQKYQGAKRVGSITTIRHNPNGFTDLERSDYYSSTTLTIVPGLFLQELGPSETGYGVCGI